MTRALAALGLALLVVVIVPAGVSLTVAGIASARPFHDERVLRPTAGGVSLDAGRLPVTVTASPDADVHVTTTGTYTLSSPTISVGPTTTVSPSAPAPPGSSDPSVPVTGGSVLGVSVLGCFRCDLGVTLGVPSAVPVTVEGTATSITAVGVAAPLNLQTSAGAITGRDLAAPRVDAETADGAITLALRVPASATASTANGNITVTAPATTGYDLDPQTSNGRVIATLPDAPGSPLVLSVHTSNGDIVLSPP